MPSPPTWCSWLKGTGCSSGTLTPAELLPERDEHVLRDVAPRADASGPLPLRHLDVERVQAERVHHGRAQLGDRVARREPERLLLERDALSFPELARRLPEQDDGENVR